MAALRTLISRYKRKLFYFPEDLRRDLTRCLTQENMCSPELKATQLGLFHHYQTLARDTAPLPSIFETGYRVYSQFDEDGKILFLMAIMGIKKRLFVDIGAADGINSNCTNLAINLGFHGLFIDGNDQSIERGRQFYSKHPDTWAFPPKFVCALVRRDNINQLIEQAGFSGEVDFLSIDIDGNDYWIWDALQVIQPRIVMIETQVAFGYNNIVVPYDPEHIYPGRHPDYFGASPVAMVNLANRKGYRLVGSNLYGFNTIYIRKDEGVGLLPTLTCEQILAHPRNKERFALFEPIKDWDYVQG